MGYYDFPEAEMIARNIDYDLGAALEYNPQPFTVGDIKMVHAVVEGEHDERDWYWIIELRDGRYVYLTGGCDFTGWDCQSSATSTFHTTVSGAAQDATEADRSGPVRSELLRQLEVKQKTVTRAEKLDREFGR